MEGIPAPGEILAGKYRIEEPLGRGGMGVVLGAHHLHLDQPVAIKLLRADLAKSPAIVERFLREARAACRIESEHVARVMDVDLLPSGAPYLVMERLVGEDLSSLVQREGPLPPARAARHVREACEALAEAHALGIVHRDIKPSNLFAARRQGGSERTKVLDFGVSKLFGAEELTSTGVSLGTPGYMAPEQLVSARTVDAQADIWALGVVLYKLSTGTLPFRATTAAELGMSILVGPPVPPREARPDLPEELEAVILRCLVKDPGGRFATVQELSAALAPIAATGEPVAGSRAVDAPLQAARTSDVATLSQETAAPRSGEPSAPSAAAPVTVPDRASTAPGVHVPARSGKARPRAWASLALAAGLFAGGAMATLVVVGRDAPPEGATGVPAAETATLAAGATTAAESPPAVTASPAPVAPSASATAEEARPAPTTSASTSPPRDARGPARSAAPPGTPPAGSTSPTSAAPATTPIEDPFGWKRK